MSAASPSVPSSAIPLLGLESISLGGTLGALQISTMVTSAVYGVTVSQTYVYWHSKSNDSALFRATVAFIWGLDTLHQVFICAMAFTYTVTDFGNVFALARESWAIISIIVVSAIMHTGIRRQPILRSNLVANKNWTLVALIMLCSFGELVALLVFTVKDVTVAHSQFLELRLLSPEFYVATCLTIVADSLIAISQVILLWRRRSRVRRTDSIVRTLIIFSINTGLLTTICALCMLVTWTTMPDKLVYDIFFAALPTLLFNALLATLNARQDLRDKVKGPNGVVSLPLSLAAPTSSSASTQVGKSQDIREAGVIEIKVERSEHLV
ncbi:hypothetical protein CERSUDRAFT_99501 [Gelatoporia subvermispora B]|uniref:DUF6534 domain-containing protein n=1 Tax=Ceriporiopsis subvermispora (strain B) TaxID=914234 RepID=M2R0R1_CERS8|nr:hypothetical protein CERSUDRAFT_99501 [Gelatoporia subvermispora B]